MSSHRILPNIFADSIKRFHIENPHFRESFLPDRRNVPEFSSRSKGEPAFDKLNGAFDGRVAINCQQKMEMVRHDYELV